MKQLTLVSIGGLANRIYAINSAIAFYKDYDVKLRIIWFKVEIIDAKWYHYIYDRPRKRNLWLPFVIQTFCFNFRYYEKNVLQKLNIDSIMNSPLSLFVIRMDREIASNPDIHFYIASDSMNEKLELQKQYGDRIIMSLKEVQRNNKDGIIDALIELYILSRTCKIYGSAHSSFSTLAAGIGGVELEIVSLKK